MPRKTKPKSTFDKLLAFKIVDPSLQTLLLMYYFYVLDEHDNSFRTVFFGLLALQVISFLVNYFLDFYKKRSVERWIFAVVALLWWGLYYYFKNNVKDVAVTDIDLQMFAKTGIHDFYIMLVGLVIAAWYFSICFREVASVTKKQQRNG